MQFIIVALLGTAVQASYEVSFHTHFANEAANKAAPYYNLSQYGILGGQLPKVYNLGNSTPVYDAEASFHEFQDILSGKSNVSFPKTTTHRSRDNSNALYMKLIGENCYDTYGQVIDDSQCLTGSCSPWYFVVIYYIDNGFITFWYSNPSVF